MGMTEFLILWLGSIISSFCMEIANELRMFEDVADAGYKIDIKRLSELGKQLNPNASKATFLSMLVPMVNIMLVFQRTIQYSNSRSMILTQLSMMDVLEEMTEIEKEEYLRKPTGLNALLIVLKTEIRLANAVVARFKDGNEISEIFYEPGKLLDDITILKVNGPASRLTVEEQKEKVIKIQEDLIKTLEEALEQDLTDESNPIKVEISKNSENQITISKDNFITMSPEERLEDLKVERDFLIKEKENQTPEYENTKGSYRKSYK